MPEKENIVTEIQVSTELDRLLLIRAGVFLLFEVDGDCCSTSYIHDLNGFDVLIGAQVLTVEDVDFPLPEQDHGEIKFYGWKIKTTKGWADLIFRNESNGYYGGTGYHYWLTDTERNDMRQTFHQVKGDGDLLQWVSTNA